MLRKLSALAAAGLTLALAGSALAAGGETKHPKEVDWTFSGPFGKFDPVQLQRGAKVYFEVCASCHAADQMFFRNLGQKGGPFYDPKYPNPNDNPRVKSLAANYDFPEIDSETGDAVDRPGVPADHFPRPYKNAAAAAAGNGGAVPPDLSVIVKARHDGANYVYSLMTGYTRDVPSSVHLQPGQHYNPYFPGGVLAMPQPIKKEGHVTYDDGTKPTINQQAKDVTAFLAWMSDPKATERKQIGVVVMIYLLLLAGLTYASYRRVWRNESH